MTELEKKIKHYADEYYRGNELISDIEYDMMIAQLRNENPHSELLNTVVGDDLVQGFKEVPHMMTTGTYSKCATVEEFKEWFNKHPTQYHVSYKIDGSGIELIYKEGKLVQAITRGDGYKGLDVTENVMKINDITKDVGSDFNGSIRGEYFLKKSTFNRCFKDVMKNPRNACAGIMKRIDGTDCDKLSFIAYDIYEEDGEKTVTEKYLKLSEFGFSVPPCLITDNLTYILNWREQVQNIRKELEYEIDGLVVKNNHIDTNDMMRKVPMNDIAIKFDLVEARTKVLNVDWQLRGTEFCPVANFEPVELCGTTVTKASLHNIKIMSDMGFYDNSTINVVKRGEIIPNMESVIEPKVNHDYKNPLFSYPKTCPCCGELTEIKVNEKNGEVTSVTLRCENKNCSQKIEHWFSRFFDVLEIKGAGEAYIKDLVKNKETPISMIDKIVSGKDFLSDLFGKNGEKLYKSITKKLEENISLGKFLSLLDFEGYSEKTLEKLPYGEVEQVLKIKYEDIVKTEGFSDISATELVQLISENENKIKELSKYFKIKSSVVKCGNLENLSFCFTGSACKPRKELEKIVVENGGIVKSGVAKGLSYLVTDDVDSGSSKNKKAKEIGTPIISSIEFLKMAGV